MGHPILEVLVEQSNRFQRHPFCPHCGNPFIFLDATFWIDGQNEACTIALPVCLACHSESVNYIAALFKTDERKISRPIVAAETAIALRAKELLGTESDHSQEKAALYSALLGVHSLRGGTDWNNSSARVIKKEKHFVA